MADKRLIDSVGTHHGASDGRFEFNGFGGGGIVHGSDCIVFGGRSMVRPYNGGWGKVKNGEWIKRVAEIFSNFVRYKVNMT